jgi:hypothetical protein
MSAFCTACSSEDCSSIAVTLSPLLSLCVAVLRATITFASARGASREERANRLAPADGAPRGPRCADIERVWVVDRGAAVVTARAFERGDERGIAATFATSCSSYEIITFALAQAFSFNA